MKIVQKYIAWDGQWCDTMTECERYEKEVEKSFKDSYRIGETSLYNIFPLGGDNKVEIYKVTEVSVDFIKAYIENKVGCINDCNGLDNLPNLVGKEIMVIWSACDYDWADIYTLEEFMDYMKNGYLKAKYDNKED